MFPAEQVFVGRDEKRAPLKRLRGRLMRQPFAYDANDTNESTRRLVEDGMSTGLTNTRTARGFSVLYHVFTRKQCILCSALLHKSYLKAIYVRSIRDSLRRV